MTGLENLLKEIEGLSQDEANQILDSAKIEAGKVEEENLKKIESHTKEIIEKSKVMAKNLVERSVSNRKILGRNEILMLKQNLISDGVSKAKQKLPQLPDPEYFGILKNWAGQADISENAVVCLNKRDLSRNMGDFLTVFPKGAKLSKDPTDISGGFLAVCGGVTINCSIDSVFEFHSDVINREVQRILFD